MQRVLVTFSKKKDRRGLNVSKKLAKIVLENPSRALDFAASIATAAASRNSKSVLATLPEVMNFCHTSEVIYFCKFVKTFTK